MNSGRIVDLIAVGKITHAHGLDGYLRIDPFSERSERFRSLKSVFLGGSPADINSVEIEGVVITNRRILLKFRGIDDRSSAEKLAGKLVFIEEKEALSLSEGTYFIHEIIGCRVLDENQSDIGIICDVLKLPGQDCWVVKRRDKNHIIPAVKEFVKEVDLKNKRVVIRLIEGLIED